MISYLIKLASVYCLFIMFTSFMSKLKDKEQEQ